MICNASLALRDRTPNLMRRKWSIGGVTRYSLAIVLKANNIIISLSKGRRSYSSAISNR